MQSGVKQLETILFLIVLAVLGFGLYWAKEYHRKSSVLNSTITRLTYCDRDIKTTLLKGLVYRFGNAAEEGDDTPWDFQRFVGRLFEQRHGGSVQVRHDYGVDIRHQRPAGLYLGQVKCCTEENKVGFEPIAIIHSQIIKQNAQGGFIVTTSQFTANASQYAAELGIELIDGAGLVEMWTEIVQSCAQKLPKPKQEA